MTNAFIFFGTREEYRMENYDLILEIDSFWFKCGNVNVFFQPIFPLLVMCYNVTYGVTVWTRR